MNQRRVLILHTGGTLGMPPRSTVRELPGARNRPQPLAPDRFAHTLTAEVPELLALAEVETRILFNLDSSDVGPGEWKVLAEEIAAARARGGWDGFVVVHG